MLQVAVRRHPLGASEPEGLVVFEHDETVPSAGCSKPGRAALPVRGARVSVLGKPGVTTVTAVDK
jgi:hypothetical protein